MPLDFLPMQKFVPILFICFFLFSHALSQPVTEEKKPEKNGTGTATPAPLDVLFATNEDCDLFINDVSKGSLSKSEHRYLKLAPGDYLYRAKGKSTGDEIKNAFSVKEGELNEVFIDLLYTVDENAKQRLTVAVRPGTSLPLNGNAGGKRAVAATENQLITINALLANLVTITGGSFIMGNNKAPASDETEHPVTVSAVHVSKYEVTQQQWESIMGENPSLYSRCVNCPVENVSWEDVMKFIRKVNVLSGKKFRLPTEAEWEYLAKLGGKEDVDRLGGTEAFIKKTAWYYGNAEKKPHPVGEKEPTAGGLYDLFGNVSEWCGDWYSDTYYKEENNSANPEGPPLGKEKTIRGGSFSEYTGDRFRPSLRNKLKPTHKTGSIGFRLVMDAY